LKPVVAANWKMHLLRAEAAAWCAAFRAGLTAEGAGTLVVFPSFPLLAEVAATLAEIGVAVGAQDLHWEERGAHTGDVSPAQVADAGARWALCGHSERRRDHGEDDATVGRKAAAAARQGLHPLICLGETGEERRRGETFAVLERQLAAALLELGTSGGTAFSLAYEPVWAIGTGVTATPETAAEAHRFLRGLPGVGPGTAILYGGSVTPANAAALSAAEDVDGFLVGGASLDPEKFLGIISACA